MKKLLILLICFVFTTLAFSRPLSDGYDYTIIFTGSFKQDVVSIKINDQSIFTNYKLDNTDPVKRGNLSLTQSEDGLTIFYNGGEIAKAKIGFEFIINISITINDVVNQFKIDLRKGKIVLVACPGDDKGIASNKLCIEQIQEAVSLTEF